MIRKKVAVVGAFAVGKTSLVQRFVTGMFSERYLTTVGVRIDKRECTVDDQPLCMLVWDLEGEDAAHRLRLSHVRGSSGLLLVADGTRPETLDVALRLADEIEAAFGPLPSVLLANKCDLRDQWTIDQERLAAERDAGRQVVETSALSGAAVENAFEELGRQMLEG